MKVIILCFAMLSYMFALHFVADFLLQSREMGTKKSTDPKWLLKHISIVFCTFVLGLLMFFKLPFVIKFAAANAIIHAAIDWHIWRVYKFFAKKKILKQVKQDHPGLSEVDTGKLVEARGSQFKYWEDEGFYVTIGADQLLHIFTIVGLFVLLILL